MSPEHAAAVIEGFKRDGQCAALPQEIFQGRFISFRQRIQSWLPTLNKRASDALWDGNDELAMRILCACGYGLEKAAHNANSRYVTQAKGQHPKTKTHDSNLIDRGNTKTNYASDWHTVKATRSKTRAKYRG